MSVGQRRERLWGFALRELAQHDLEHLWQVRQVKERLREAVSAREEE